MYSLMGHLFLPVEGGDEMDKKRFRKKSAKRYANFGILRQIAVAVILACLCLASCERPGVQERLQKKDAVFGTPVDSGEGAAMSDGQSGVQAGQSEELNSQSGTPGGQPELKDEQLEIPGGQSGMADGQDQETAMYLEEKQQDKIYVYVCGAVKKPGVYTLNAGERQIAAVEAAGGMTEEACAAGMNLAAVLNDGERIYVPTMEEASEAGLSGDMKYISGGLYSGDTASQHPEERVNLNTATKEELMTLPGIGASKAGKIIQYREDNGRFTDVGQLKNVPGIKEGTYEGLKDMITI